MIRRIFYLLLVTVLLGGLAGAIAFYAFDFKPKMLAEVILGAPRPPETVSAEAGTHRHLAAADRRHRHAHGIGGHRHHATGRRHGEGDQFRIRAGRARRAQLLVKLDTATEEADMRSIAAELANTETDWNAARRRSPTRASWPRTELDALTHPEARARRRRLDRRRADRGAEVHLCAVGRPCRPARTSRSAAIWRPARRSSGCRRSIRSMPIFTVTEAELRPDPRRDRR